MSRARLTLAALAAAALLAGVPTTAASGAPVTAGSAAAGTAANGPAGTAVAAAAAPSIDWGSCDRFGLYAARARCGYLSVPLDYGHPDGKHIKLAVSRIKHRSTEADFQGPILVNPGGPGGAGLPFATIGSSVPNHVGDRYDWIGFDPRGIGESRPALSCRPHYFHVNRPDYRPRTHHLMKVWKRRSRDYAEACAAKHPRLIRHMTTADSARDMEQIRLALGASQISFYGFSYGTYLGQVYASLFPDRLERMVLDSTVDPRRVWYRANLDQDVAFDRNIRIWFRWVAKYHDHYRLGSTGKSVRKKWYAALDELAKHPAGGKLGPDEWTDAFLYAGYYRDTWLDLGRAFSRYVHGGHWRPALDFYRAYNDTRDDNGYAGYLAVECTDAPWPNRWHRWRNDAERIYDKAPFLAWDNTWFNAPCRWWKAPSRQPVPIDGPDVASVLLIGETLDAATPFSGSLEVRRRFPHSSLIGEPGGTTHADTLYGNGCVDNRIARYLATGARPARKNGDRADHLCDPLPDPRPRG